MRRARGIKLGFSSTLYCNLRGRACTVSVITLITQALKDLNAVLYQGPVRDHRVLQLLYMTQTLLFAAASLMAYYIRDLILLTKFRRVEELCKAQEWAIPLDAERVRSGVCSLCKVDLRDSTRICVRCRNSVEFMEHWFSQQNSLASPMTIRSID